MKIAVVAPSCRIEPQHAEAVVALAKRLHPAAEIYIHPQCFLSEGHFAGPDAARTAAFVEIANDESVDALWFARGGYGSCRIAEDVIARLSPAARRKTFLGYSDAGALLAALYAAGFEKVAHGPMPSDIKRAGGEIAVMRALAYLVARDHGTLEPSIAAAIKHAAFNITILSQLLGTPIEPDLKGHVLMLEEVSEAHYRIDRALFHITSNPRMRKVAGVKLGRCSDIPPNDPAFGKNEVEITKYWCAKSGIPYLGRADIGHDIDNKIVPFGAF